MHVGIIPDGNRRWATEHGLSVREGHLTGARALENILKHAITTRDIREISIYSLSLENLEKRSREELKNIFKIQSKYFAKFSENPIVHREEVRGRILGFTELLPSNVLEAARRMEKATKEYSRHFINFLMPYSGQQEIIQAAQRMILPPYGPLTLSNLRSNFEENLFVKSPVDLIIRTAEQRLSNFLPYQTAYAEWVFVDKYWPSFTTGDFDMCLEKYSKRIRRKGR